MIALSFFLIPSCKYGSTPSNLMEASFFDFSRLSVTKKPIVVTKLDPANYRLNAILTSDYYTLGIGRVSSWDKLIKSSSDSLKWDWRLLASLVCQESGFDPNVRSWAGAYGLMQLMPATGRSFGIDVKASPEDNMRAGVLYINYLQDFFSNKVQDSTERLKFVLAAYNAGEGNLLDAMKLALKNGKDPARWEGNVAIFLKRKSDPLYYNDPVVENGFCRGDEPVNFVSQILKRYSHYKITIPSSKSSPF